MYFDRTIFFDTVRELVFDGSLSDEQVEGMECILGIWEAEAPSDDLRHLSYPLATTKHETANTMWPIEEYGKGEGSDYGNPDPVTGEVYYGRGFVQLTWAENYKRADEELGFEDDASCYLHATNALNPFTAADIMFIGMEEGWFRSGQTLDRYFNSVDDDPYGAREIINGDKHYTPDWANGKEIGTIIAEYHDGFLTALKESYREGEAGVPPHRQVTLTLVVRAPPGVSVQIEVEGADDTVN